MNNIHRDENFEKFCKLIKFVHEFVLWEKNQNRLRIQASRSDPEDDLDFDIDDDDLGEEISRKEVSRELDDLWPIDQYPKRYQCFVDPDEGVVSKEKVRSCILRNKYFRRDLKEFVDRGIMRLKRSENIVDYCGNFIKPLESLNVFIPIQPALDALRNSPDHRRLDGSSALERKAKWRENESNRQNENAQERARKIKKKANETFRDTIKRQSMQNERQKRCRVNKATRKSLSAQLAELLE